MNFYTSRETRQEWIVKNFPEIFQNINSVLDVGCDQRQMLEFLEKHIKYVGIDVSDGADIQIDLDSTKALPFSDNEFDAVLALDTLEHLEEFHFIFDELCRISNKYIIITLPNPLSQIPWNYFMGRKHAHTLEERKKEGTYTKPYGLPLEKPEDRHRWFFNTEESINFINYRAEKNGFNVRDIGYSIDYQSKLKKFIKFVLAGFSRKRMLNFFTDSTIFLLERK
ncbi:MAG: class I SAM-dependent methyltransferase [Patescibacteria group bacterium]|nr:class I SAM-dependent methyltransferase [Patescibacteria group bacterium]